MPRRRPCCAYCGEPLTRTRGATQHDFYGLPGKPAVAWHGLGRDDCHAQDHLSQELWRTTSEGLMAVLREIEARDPERVVANKGWPRLVTAEQAESCATSSFAERCLVNYRDRTETCERPLRPQLN